MFCLYYYASFIQCKTLSVIEVFSLNPLSFSLIWAATGGPVSCSLFREERTEGPRAESRAKSVIVSRL